ncbi:hypothetical protein [Paenibacillus ehimensis]|uniref:Uncharacterized protein n=1 Tax=Paenibacillus ehimensis TaxID=79264 RepID=A0ABT8VMD1_9BACL|nr:hypothetical protein [Paenibacillus ehimensis]MDO3682153.1 hypothetical protein [Paenibacillus ehimensis]
MNKVDGKQLKEQMWEAELDRRKFEQYRKWVAADGGEVTEEDFEDSRTEFSILHESEFLRNVVKIVTEHKLTGKFGCSLDQRFLSLATGVSERLFADLIEKEDDESIRSIISATVGEFEFSRRALDYYGISFFLTITGNASDMYDLGEGYYYFNHC